MGVPSTTDASQSGAAVLGIPFTRAAEEGVIDTENSIHLGPRGTLTQPNVFEHTRKYGYELIDGCELYSRGFKDVVSHIHDRLNGRQVYLCFDMDFFDPSCAPGVCTPTWGGASAREGLSLLQGTGRSEHCGRGCKYSKPTTRCGRNDRLSGGNCHVGVYGSCLSEFTDHLLMVRHNDRC